MLQVNLVIEDAKISLDELQEEIAEIEEYVQSTDVAGMSFLFLFHPIELTVCSHAKALELRFGPFCTSTGLENECICYNATLGNSTYRPPGRKNRSRSSTLLPLSCSPFRPFTTSHTVQVDQHCTRIFVAGWPDRRR